MAGPPRSPLVRPSSTESHLALWAKSLLNASLFFAIFMLALPWGAHRLLAASLLVPPELGVPVGAVLFVGGIAVWVYCLDVFSRRSGGTPFPLDAPRQLATTGPFAVVRNPIMAGELAVIWGEAVWFASAGILLYAAILSLIAALVVRLIEEPELRERFGEQYETYTRRVPRWFPRLRRQPSA